MRALLLAGFGGAAAAFAFAISQLGGFVGAAALMLALAAVVITVGLVLAIPLNAWLDRPCWKQGWSVRRWHARRLSWRDPVRCSECGRPRACNKSVWVCLTCDRVPTGSTADQS